jgi:phage shock protein PspC (stress-responsive transcriptional regulator)
VCTGLARQRDLPVQWIRATFALAALVGGIGVLAYVACWLIIPAEGDGADGPAGTRGIVVLAAVCAACVGLATLAALGSAAAIFGFGWAVVVIAGVVLVGVLTGWPRPGAAWALLPVGALVLPALAMTLGGVRLDPSSRDLEIAPRSVAGLRPDAYRSGLGSLFFDLRNTAFPAGGTVTLRIDAGLRRTIVALPSNRCVHVEVNYDVVPFAARLAATVTGRDEPFSGVTLFGDTQSSQDGEAGNIPATTAGRTPGSPVLDIDFHSAGGSLYVRDYPDYLDPQSTPDWPGYAVTLEPRPDTAGETPAAARQMIDAWLLRRRVQSASAAALARLLPGPCGASGALPVTAQTTESAGPPPTAVPASGPPAPALAAAGSPAAPQPPQPPGVASTATTATETKTKTKTARSQTARPDTSRPQTTRPRTAGAHAARPRPGRSPADRTHLTRARVSRTQKTGSAG